MSMMNNFYCLFNSDYSDSKKLEERIISIENACVRTEVRFVSIDESKYDFTELPNVTPLDAIYNCSRGSLLLEQQMLRNNPRTVYRDLPITAVSQDNHLWGIMIEQHGIATPKTIWYCNSDRHCLQKYVNYLGGFPLVLKVHSGSSGVGVIFISDWKALFSNTEFLVANKISFSLREYIASTSCERLIVLNDQVIASCSRPIAQDDFRSDSNPLNCNEIKFDSKITKLAIEAAHAANLNFAGVDVIKDERNSKAYILEINCPFDVHACEKVLGSSFIDQFISWITSK